LNYLIVNGSRSCGHQGAWKPNARRTVVLQGADMKKPPEGGLFFHAALALDERLVNLGKDAGKR
jgi:hypothetical protein